MSYRKSRHQWLEPASFSLLSPLFPPLRPFLSVPTLSLPQKPKVRQSRASASSQETVFPPPTPWQEAFTPWPQQGCWTSRHLACIPGRRKVFSYLARNALPLESRLHFFEHVTIAWQRMLGDQAFLGEYIANPNKIWVVFFFLFGFFFSKEQRRIAMPLLWWPQVNSQVFNRFCCFYEQDRFSYCNF